MVLASCLPFVALAGPIQPSYKPGERSSYAVTYFGATAGILDLEVLPNRKEGGTEQREFVAKARTDSIFSLFYRLKNTYRSIVNAGTGLPIRWEALLDESRQSGTTAQEFDHARNRVRFLDKREETKRGKVEKNVLHDMFPGSQDVISAVFHMRDLPLVKGKSFELPVVIGEESCRLRLEVVDEEELPTKIGKIASFVIKPSLLKDGQVKEVPETFLWIGNNSNRALLKVKAKVKIGSVIAYLRSYESGEK